MVVKYFFEANFSHPDCFIAPKIGNFSVPLEQSARY